jgi:hypothetical protein
MIYAAIYLLLLLVVLDRVHSLSLSTDVFRYQCRLFEIRDNLREGVVNGSVDPSHWVFHYLDSTIVKTIDSLGSLTLWRIIGLALSGVDSTTIRAQEALTVELDKSGNEYVKKVYTMYNSMVTLYLIERSVAIKTILRCLLGVVDLREHAQRQVRKIVCITTTAAETSTLAEFAPA